MSERRLIVSAVAVLVGGIVIGILLAALFDGGDGEDVATTASTSSTTEAPATDPPTTELSTTSSTTTTVVPPPLADLTDGRLLGFPIGSPMAAVEEALVARLGTPDIDTGWTTGCPLDGDEDLDERGVWWGDLHVTFAREGGLDRVDAWSFGDARPPDPVVPTGPLASDIVMPDGVAWGQSIAEVAAVLDLSLDGVEGVQDVFLLTWVYDGEARYLAAEPDVNAPFVEVAWRPTVCE